MRQRLGGGQHIIALVALIVGLFIVLSVLAPNTYPTFRNIASMANQMAPIGILALCVGLTFLVGGIDLSIVAVANGAAIGLALTVTALEPSLGAGPATVVGLLVAVTVGAIAGTVNGLLVSYLKVHPIPITLGTMGIFTGIATGITGGSTVYGTGTLNALGRGTVAGIPISFLFFAAIVVILSVVTTRTRFGFRVYSVGASEKVARFARMNVARVQVGTYVLSGILASLAGILMFGGTNSANVSFGSSFLIQAILVAVVTGIDTFGGRGRIALVVLSVAAMQQIQTGINMALGTWGGANFAAEFGWGVLLIAVLGISQRMGDGSRAPGWRFWLKGKDQRPDAAPPAATEPELAGPAGGAVDPDGDTTGALRTTDQDPRT
ncbi:ABC transporter permease [Spiractinospora alimapuensis]|uniref:ABC transporter permease n=1 Tax=Spiractinospora alimapuensis TaxID=2820884 RepID=UPI001F2BB7C2|nr:ABC transporter permease [Spiractinospora alimapuensis]QVQ53848.1 ABC transporter permease [Spiractinospora alimapuensis]